MNTAKLKETCEGCKLAGVFQGLSAEALNDLDAIKVHLSYPAHATLFSEAEQPNGVFVLCGGQVKHSVSSSEGKSLTLRVAKAGDVLGLTSVLLGKLHAATAETLYPCSLAFIRRGDLMRFLASHPEIYLNIARELSSQYRTACEQLRNLGLSSSVPARIARLLLEWAANGRSTGRGLTLQVPWTHEEIAQFVGTSRESVTRTLSDFVHRHLLEKQGVTVTIQNRAGLESLAAA